MIGISIKYEDGKIVYTKPARVVDYSRYISVVLENQIDLGECSCCGEHSKLSYGNNFIYLHCEYKDGIKNGFECKFRFNCPGTDNCPNMQKFDAERIETTEKIIVKIACSMLKHHNSFIINETTESRNVIAKYFLKDTMFDVDVFTMTEEKETNVFYIVICNKRVLKDRKNINNEYESLIDIQTKDEVEKSRNEIG